MSTNYLATEITSSQISPYNATLLRNRHSCRSHFPSTAISSPIRTSSTHFSLNFTIRIYIYIYSILLRLKIRKDKKFGWKRKFDRSQILLYIYIYVCRTYYLNIEIEVAEDRKTVQRVNFFRLIDYPPLETFHVRHALGFVLANCGGVAPPTDPLTSFGERNGRGQRPPPPT